MGEYVDWVDENQNKSLAIQLSKLTKVRQIIAQEKITSHLRIDRPGS